MSRVEFAVGVSRLAIVVLACAALCACQAIREATGAAKVPPDEFTILTKAPLVLPPDYNLRPPQPGIASRNDPNAEDQARAALFPQTPQEQVQALGPSYSDGEKLLLQKTGALGADPNVRRAITNDVGLEDQGPAFAQRVLYPQSTAAATPQSQSGATVAGASGTPVAAPPPARPSAESILYPATEGAAAAVQAQPAAPAAAAEPDPAPSATVDAH